MIILSISESCDPVALSLKSSSVFISLALRASSPALFTNPHFTHISTRSAGLRFVHFGMNVEASFVFPAERISL